MYVVAHDSSRPDSATSTISSFSALPLFSLSIGFVSLCYSTLYTLFYFAIFFSTTVQFVQRSAFLDSRFAPLPPCRTIWANKPHTYHIWKSKNYFLKITQPNKWGASIYLQYKNVFLLWSVYFVALTGQTTPSAGGQRAILIMIKLKMETLEGRRKEEKSSVSS